MSEEQEYYANISIQEQPDGGFLVQWRGKDGRMTHATVKEQKEDVYKLIQQILEEK